MRAISLWLTASGIADGPVLRCIWLPRLPTGNDPLSMTPRAIANIIQARAVAAGFGRRDLAGRSLKRGALTTGMDLGIHPAKLKRLGRHKSFDVLASISSSAISSKGTR